MLTLQGVAYTHPNRDKLFADINFIVRTRDKVALVGNNGSGKSTLLNIIAGKSKASSGIVKTDSKLYYVPQVTGQFNNQSVAEVLQIDAKLKALNEILNDHATEQNLSFLDDDWTIEERCREAFAYWNLQALNLRQKTKTLSGGQKTKVLLAGIMIHQPELVLLDEPSNHLDAVSRKILYQYIKSTSQTLLVVSHDRTLLNLLHTIYELDTRGVTVYGGNYDFYAEQKKIEHEALRQDVKSKEKELRKAKEIEREALERKQKLDARGKKKQQKAGLPTISMNTFRNNAEKSSSRLRDVHAEKTGTISKELNQLRDTLPNTDKMKIDLSHAALHRGKTLITAKHINISFGQHVLWKNGLSFQIIRGERVAIKGSNGSGKTTLIRLLTGDVIPSIGTLEKRVKNIMYMDQDYSMIDQTLLVYEQAQQFNSSGLQEHDIKIRLNRFLFTKEHWHKSCGVLSGGEKLRLILCCLTISNQAPEMIILDEPTNNLDLQNIEILTMAINNYRGTLIVISHDDYFLKQIDVGRSIELA